MNRVRFALLAAGTLLAAAPTLAVAQDAGPGRQERGGPPDGGGGWRGRGGPPPGAGQPPAPPAPPQAPQAPGAGGPGRGFGGPDGGRGGDRGQGWNRGPGGGPDGGRGWDRGAGDRGQNWNRGPGGGGPGDGGGRGWDRRPDRGPGNGGPGDGRGPRPDDRGQGWNRGPGGFDRGPGGFDRGPGGFDRGRDGFNRGPGGFDRGPGPDRFVGRPGAGFPGGARWRSDPRYDWRGWRARNGGIFHAPRYLPPPGYGFGYRRFSIGVRLAPYFYGENYWIDDPYFYRLPPAYGPYRWVRYYNDVLLIDLRTGLIVDAIPDFFW